MPDSNKGGVVAQSGLRHAIALEKLMNSNESQDSVLRNLLEMVPFSPEASVYRPDNMAESFTEKFTYQQRNDDLRRKGKSVVTDNMYRS